MNREEIIHRLKALPYNPENFWVNLEAAKVLNGIRAGAASIELGCDDVMADALEADEYLHIKSPAKGEGRRTFVIGDGKIIVREWVLTGDFNWIEGFQVSDAQAIYWAEDKRMRAWGLEPEKFREVSTEHYVFHFSEGSVAEKNIEIIKEGQEKVFSNLCNLLNVKPDFMIQYYLLDSREQLALIRNSGEPVNGFFSEPDTIFAVVNDRIKCLGFHEDTHLFAYLINEPDSMAIKEGIANCFSQVYAGKENLAWAVWLVKKGRLVDVDKLLDNEYYESQEKTFTYPLLGAFTDFLIRAKGGGLEKYREFYKYKDSAEGMQKIYGKTPAELNQLFETFLKGLNLKDGVEDEIDALVARHGLEI